MRLISLDPGGTTGYVVWDTDFGMGTHGQLGPNDHHYVLWKLLIEQDDYMSGNLTVICERFDHRNAEFAKLISNEYIGVVKLFEQITGINNSPVKVVWQGSSIKTWADNEKLKKLGLLIKPIKANKDANDAMRHMVYYLCHYMSVNTELQQARTQLLDKLKP